MFVGDLLHIATHLLHLSAKRMELFTDQMFENNRNNLPGSPLHVDSSLAQEKPGMINNASAQFRADPPFVYNYNKAQKDRYSSHQVNSQLNYVVQNNSHSSHSNSSTNFCEFKSEGKNI